MQSESKLHLYDLVKADQKFGKWKTTNELKKRGSSQYIKCVCECGLPQDVLIYDLIRKKSTQCRSCVITKRNIKHGQNFHGNISYEYHLWQNLKSKKLLDVQWKESFELFFNDIGKRPKEGFILQRHNLRFLYSISNFFWAHPRERFFLDLKDQKFGKWTLIEKDFIGDGVRWQCICECGNKDYISQTNLINGVSTKCKSCAMKGKGFKKTHGLSKNGICRIFYGMKARCYNKNSPSFNHYGGRGIKICDRWLQSTENFINDMGDRPSLLHSIDRIDVNSDYCPENCKWSTQKEQTLNRRKVPELQNEIFILKQKIKEYEASLSNSSFELR